MAKFGMYSLMLLALCVCYHASAQDALPVSCDQAPAPKIVLGEAAPLPQADAGKAVVVFIADPLLCRVGNQCLHSTLPSKLSIDGTLKAAGQGFSYMAIVVDPGVHHFCGVLDVKPGKTSVLASLLGLHVEAGKTYYLRARISVTYDVKDDALELLLADPDDGRYLAAHARQAQFAR